MKKSFIASCLFVFSFFQTFSQINIALKCGLNISNVHFAESSDRQTKLAFYGGLLSEITLKKRLIIQPELLYSIKGNKFPPTDLSAGGHLNLNYISLPLLLGYKPLNNLKILLGPEFSFLTSSKSKINSTAINLTNIYKKFDLGIDLGLVYQISKNAGVEARYNYGLSYLLEGEITDVGGNPLGRVKVGNNRVLQVGLFYRFGKH